MVVDVPEKNGSAKKERNGSGSDTKLVAFDINLPYRSVKLRGMRPWRYPEK